MKMLGGNKTDGESHVAAPAPAASAVHIRQTTKAKPKFDDGFDEDLSKTQPPTGGIIPHGVLLCRWFYNHPPTRDTPEYPVGCSGVSRAGYTKEASWKRKN